MNRLVNKRWIEKKSKKDFNVNVSVENEEQLINASTEIDPEIMLYVAIASISIIGLVATTIVAKKKKMN